jgi:hypothetical protein
MLQQTLQFLNTNSAALTAISVIIAGLIWVLKMPYEKHRKEMLSLSKLERLLIMNEAALGDNIDLIDQWIMGLSELRPYSAHFESMLFDESNYHSLSNMNLINELFQINHKLKRSSNDLNNIYKSYWEIIPKIDEIDPIKKLELLKTYSDNVIGPLKDIKEGAVLLKKEIVPVIAHIQVMGNVRFHSLFGYLNLLNRDIIPRPTREKIDERIKQIIIKQESKK